MTDRPRRVRRHGTAVVRVPIRAAQIAGLVLGLAACGGIWKVAGDTAGVIWRQASATPARSLPVTRAERTNYRETSSYADVTAFLDSLQSLGLPMRVASLGRSTEGRDIPYVVASRPLVTTPAEARRLGRPIVYVQANIHGGEIEGKEAMQALLRDLLAEQRPNALDSLVLILVPIYNTDGNERLGPQARNRGEQNGPELVGERSNGQRLDLNRDYVKAEAPETRAALALFDAWDPDVFTDLHTTNGSYHGYALTYSPSLHPGAEAFGGGLARDSLLPELRRRMRVRHGYETFDYGNFSLEYGADVNTDTTRQGWYTYDHRARYGTNYYGLRGGVAILAEGYSHDPLERRVKSMYAFLDELLSLAAERAASIARVRRAWDGRLAASGGGAGPASGVALPVRSALTTTPFVTDVISEDLAREADTTRLTEPGVPRGLRRTGRMRTLRLGVYDRFTPSLSRPLPAAYMVPAGSVAALALLRTHGVRMEQTTRAWRARTERFTVDSVIVAPRPFQGHHEVRLEGRWQEMIEPLPAGVVIVDLRQPLGALAALLLEPESDDGFSTWNLFDRDVVAGESFPVRRVRELPAVPRRAFVP